MHSLVGKTSETVGLFQGAKCDSVPKRLVSSFRFLLPVSIAWHRTPTDPVIRRTRGNIGTFSAGGIPTRAASLP